MKTTEDCEDQCPYFEANIQYTNEQPAGFKDWTNNITQCKNKIYLPDNTSLDYKLFMDSINNQFKDNDFTNFLLNRYNEIYG